MGPTTTLHYPPQCLEICGLCREKKKRNRVRYHDKSHICLNLARFRIFFSSQNYLWISPKTRGESWHWDPEYEYSNFLRSNIRVFEYSSSPKNCTPRALKSHDTTLIEPSSSHFFGYIGWWVICALSTREEMFTTQSAHQYLPTAALKLQISMVNACIMYERVLWFIPSTIIFEKTEQVLEYSIIVSPLPKTWAKDAIFF